MRLLLCCLLIAALGNGDFLQAATDSAPAPVNPYKGMQEREEVFEFAAKPAVKKEGGKWVISFAAKGKCDATVAILDKDGKVIRHLASGVLGANAPYPFQQDALAQKIEWDGLKDDFSKADAAGCTVKVSLGLRPKFDRNVLYDPNFLPRFGRPEYKILTGKTESGDNAVFAFSDRGSNLGRVYDKDGKYVRTFFPPPASDLEKLGEFKMRFATTKWGDKTVVSSQYGPFQSGKTGLDGKKVLSVFAGVNTVQEENAWPAWLAKGEDKAKKVFDSKFSLMTADRARDEVYLTDGEGNVLRLGGSAMQIDETFPGHLGTGISDLCVGVNGLLYFRIGGASNGFYVVRVDRNGKAVPFSGNGSVPLPSSRWHDTGKPIYCSMRTGKDLSRQPDVSALWTGKREHSNTHARGLYVAPTGTIVANVLSIDRDWGSKHGIPQDTPSRSSIAGDGIFKFDKNAAFTVVWDKDGNLLTSNAAGNMGNGHGVTMDRDGNLYGAIGGRTPDGIKEDKMDGITDEGLGINTWGGFGTLVKFHGQGGTFPLSPGTIKDHKVNKAAPGVLWTYVGLNGQSTGKCTCHFIRNDMDFYARHFVIANQLNSIVVLDANGNRIARLGRYGNADDTEADLKDKKDGLRFAWLRAVCVSDRALYALDQSNRRILRAEISYVAEETVPLP